CTRAPITMAARLDYW
nr:immunoglobulin heavy chain junction region [Macaca mulatta]MOV39329.1 immunoglobulin heavy chain junction region [Macaca mulatta]MOV44063.1 immunoglobulin heavy chain junction region [Macaca mulatta]MOV44552.1 immunoglobulin heavy chain junction region [Macaca mulatta]